MRSPWGSNIRLHPATHPQETVGQDFEPRSLMSR
jgi:hypothetical protein